MTIRIGELLVRRGMITEAQLEHALSAQLVYGGHLGTCLIEQGLVNEIDLGMALSEIYEVGYAPLESLANVDGPVIETVPRKIVEKHCLLPFDLEGGVLHLAMIDPRDISALDEAAHASGLKTKAWVSPEIRVLQAMERYYRIPRRLRFVAICRELDREKPFTRAADPVSKPDPPRAEPAARDDSGCFLGFDAAGEGRENRGFEDLGSEFGYGRSWLDIVAEDQAPSRLPPSPLPVDARPRPIDAVREPCAVSAEPAPPGGSVARSGLDEATERMCRAEDHDELGRALLDYAARGTPRCVLWRVDGVWATVWEQRGFPALERARLAVRIPVVEEPVFRLIAGAPCYRGPGPTDEGGLRYFGRLGVEPPSEILLFPLHVDDRLVAVFYGDCGALPCIQARTEEYRRALLKLAHALAIVELKRTIRAV